jgi:hypothetical protein
VPASLHNEHNALPTVPQSFFFSGSFQSAPCSVDTIAGTGRALNWYSFTLEFVLPVANTSLESLS